ncbi:hypothetical protein Efla_007703 [Eimeria flavescens]
MSFKNGDKTQKLCGLSNLLVFSRAPERGPPQPPVNPAAFQGPPPILSVCGLQPAASAVPFWCCFSATKLPWGPPGGPPRRQAMDELDPLACFGCEGEEENLFEGLFSSDEEGASRGGGHLRGLLQGDGEEQGEGPHSSGGPSGAPFRVFAPSRQVCIWAVDADRSLLFARQPSPQEAGGLEGAPIQETAEVSCFWKELMQAGASFVRSRLYEKEPLFFGVILFNADSAAEEGAPLGAPPLQEKLQGAPRGAPASELVTPGIAVVLPLQEASISTIESLMALGALERSAFDEAFPAPNQRPPFSGRLSV